MPSPPATREIIETLSSQYPDADTELRHRNAYELLVATMLSAQSTDARVNLVTPRLFEKYPDARALSRARQATLEREIASTGFFRQKAKALIGTARILVDEHNGEVPAAMEALTRLPGVGRKTASVVLGHALGVPALPVDRHVLRVSTRLGIAEGDDPERVEFQLRAALPPAIWTHASDVLILHGRRVCRPKPACETCVARDRCAHYAQVVSAQRPVPQVGRGTASREATRVRRTTRRDRRPGKQP